MAYTRAKKLTDPTYAPTNPASESDIRSQVDGSIEEAFTMIQGTTSGSSGADYIGAPAIKPGGSTTVKGQIAELAELKVEKLDVAGDFSGTWFGAPFAGSQPGLSAEVVAARGGETTLQTRLDNSDAEIVAARGGETTLQTRLDNSDAEIVAARGGETTLQTRLDNSDAEVSTHATMGTEYTATMLNGFTASITYKKNTHRIVTVVMNVHNIPTITAGTVICTLPVGYRPALFVIPCLEISTSPNKNIMPFLIGSNGNITIASGSELSVIAEAYLAGEVSYYAAT